MISALEKQPFTITFHGPDASQPAVLQIEGATLDWTVPDNLGLAPRHHVTFRQAHVAARTFEHVVATLEKAGFQPTQPCAPGLEIESDELDRVGCIVQSLEAINNPAAKTLKTRWLREMRAQLGGTDAELLALLPNNQFVRWGDAVLLEESNGLLSLWLADDDCVALQDGAWHDFPKGPAKTLSTKKLGSEPPQGHAWMNRYALHILRRLLLSPVGPRIRRLYLDLEGQAEPYFRLLNSLGRQDALTHLIHVHRYDLRPFYRLQLAFYDANIRQLPPAVEAIRVTRRSFPLLDKNDLPTLLPNLSHLSLEPLDEAELLRLQKSPLLPQLKSIAFFGRNGPPSFPFQGLRDAQPQFRHLEHLQLGGLYAAPEVVAQFADWPEVQFIHDYGRERPLWEPHLPSLALEELICHWV